MQSGPVSQRTDLEDRRNPVARGRQPAASQFSGRLAKGAIPDFDKFLDDRLLWLHTNVGRHDNRGNNVVTHRNCLPKSRARAFFSGNTHEYKIFTDQGGFSGSAGPLTLIFSFPGPLKPNIFTPRTSKSYDFGGFWNLKWTQVDTKITSRNNIMLKQPESKKYIFFP